jgi:hypothetical protein
MFVKSGSINYDVLVSTAVGSTAESRKAFRREIEARKLDVALLPPMDKVETSAERYELQARAQCPKLNKWGRRRRKSTSCSLFYSG